MQHFIALFAHLERHSQEYKVGILNAAAFFVSTIHAEKWLQIVLLIVSIFYTGFKTFEIIEKRNQAQKDRKNEDK